MFMKGMHPLFLSLGLGYALCVLAKKQEGLLRSLGYGLGIGILIITLLYGLGTACAKWPAVCKAGGPMSKIYNVAAKTCPFMK